VRKKDTHAASAQTDWATDSETHSFRPSHPRTPSLRHGLTVLFTPATKRGFLFEREGRTPVAHRCVQMESVCSRSLCTLICSV
jgi:hypothetical protein